MTIRRIRIACSITKATNTHLENVKLVPLPLQQLLQEHASVSRITYITCIVLLL